MMMMMMMIEEGRGEVRGVALMPQRYSMLIRAAVCMCVNAHQGCCVHACKCTCPCTHKIEYAYPHVNPSRTLTPSPKAQKDVHTHGHAQACRITHLLVPPRKRACAHTYTCIHTHRQLIATVQCSGPPNLVKDTHAHVRAHTNARTYTHIRT